MSGRMWSMEALQVLSLFTGGQKLHGYAVCKETQLKQSTVYRILDRLEREGLLISKRERTAANLSRRVPLVVYQSTTVAADELAQIRAYVSA